MQRLDQATVEKAVYKTSPPPALQLASAHPPSDYPSSVSKWVTYRAAIGQQPPVKVCPACGDAGFVQTGDLPYTDPNFGKIIRCDICSETGRREWLIKNCGLEEAHQGYRLADWRLGSWPDETEAECKARSDRIAERIAAKGAIEQVLERQAGLLTFWGDFGSGKTYALQIVTNEARAQMIESLYVTMADVLDHLRNLYAQKVDWSPYWQRLLDVPVLCLDEVTRYNETQWAAERVWMLADKRYSRRASHLTVFATNNDPNELLPVVEPVGYLYSRCRQGTIVELRGDMRGAAK